MKNFSKNNKILFFLNIFILAGVLAVGITYGWTNPPESPPGGAGALYYSGGNVGIGTDNPGAKLDVVGGIYNTGIRIRNNSSNGAGLSLANSDASGKTWDIISTGSNNGGGAGNLGFFEEGGDYRLYLKAGGTVGIGTASPDSNYKLTTSGGGVKAENNSATQPALYASNAGGGAATITAGIARFSSGGTTFSVGPDANQNRIQLYASGPPVRFLNSGNSYANLGMGSLSVGSSYGATAAPLSGAIIEGNVGIGKADPAWPLDVAGYIKASSGVKFGTLGVRDMSGIVTFDVGSAYPTGFNFQYGGSSASALYINSSGNVGVGTTNPNPSKGSVGYVDAKDVYLRDTGKWASESGGGTYQVACEESGTTIMCCRANRTDGATQCKAGVATPSSAWTTWTIDPFTAGSSGNYQISVSISSYYGACQANTSSGATTCKYSSGPGNGWAITVPSPW